ncbi:MAG: hypothetical protein K0R18_883 [Bacillales bacterium]|nr:hypothetical protein [Bacillales bacterium]
MQILAIIEREGTFKTVSLAERLFCSQRTLVKDLHLIKEHFGDSVAILSNNSGFHFEEQDRLLYQERKEQLLEQDVLFEILEKIFFGEETDLDELAHQYSYAESTLRRFLLRTQPVLATYDLNLSFKPVTLVGEEVNLRKFFFDFYYGSEQTPQSVRSPEGLHQLVLQELGDQLGHYEVGTGLSIAAFYSLLYLTMVRVDQGKRVQVPQWAQDVVYQEQDFGLLVALVPRIKKEYGISLPKEELAWLYLVLASKRTTKLLSHEELFLARFNQWPEANRLAADYFSSSTFDSWDRPLLETFLASFFASRRLNDILWPIWNKQQIEVVQIIKQQATYEKNKAFLLHHRVDKCFTTHFFEDIVVSFTLFSDLLLHSHQPKKTVLFLIEGDSMVVQSIRLQAQRQLGEQYHLIFPGLHELTEARLKSEKTDLVVTNYRPYLFEYAIKEDYVLLNTIPNPKDWDRVKHLLNPLLEDNKENEKLNRSSDLYGYKGDQSSKRS